MMRMRAAIYLSMLLVAPLLAQESDAAGKQAGSWFMNVRDTFLARSGAEGLKEAIDLWEAAATKATGEPAKRIDLFFLMPKFNPLWDSGNKLVAGSAAKYAKRLEQIPTAVVQTWKGLTDADALYAAASLTAENALFPQEKFNEKALQAFVAKFK